MNKKDSLFKDIKDHVLTRDEVSISYLQRKFGIGYVRSARIIDSLEEEKIVTKPDGSKPRKVLKSSQGSNKHKTNEKQSQSRSQCIIRSCRKFLGDDELLKYTDIKGKKVEENVCPKHHQLIGRYLKDSGKAKKVYAEIS